MPEEKDIGSGQVAQRSAGENAALGIAAFLATKDYIEPVAHAVIDKVARPKDEGPGVELPSGVKRPD